MPDFISYNDVIEGLHERFRTVPGINVFLKYEPKALQTTPALYTLLDTATREVMGQQTQVRYRVLCRLCIQWQDNEMAEIELIPFINSIPSAVEQDAKLGGRIPNGVALIKDIATGFVPIGETVYRIADFYADVLAKSAFKSGI